MHYLVVQTDLILCFFYLNLQVCYSVTNPLVVLSCIETRVDRKPTPMSAKLHSFATKIAVLDLFALGLEPFESKKNWPRSEQHFKKKNILKILYICPEQFNAKPNHIVPLHRNLEIFVIFAHYSQFRRCCHRIFLMSPWSLKIWFALGVVHVCWNSVCFRSSY